jgi:hypothetical protein
MPCLFSDSVVKVFRSYPTGGMQAVIGKTGDTSNWLNVDTRMVQGSACCPFLLSLFINDLPRVVTHSQYFLYSGDFQIYQHSTLECLAQTIDRLNTGIVHINAWADTMA